MEWTSRAAYPGAVCIPNLAARPFLIVFDLDGTVADSRALHRTNYKLVFERMGYGALTDEEADRLNGPGAEEICQIMGVAPERRAWYNMLYDESIVSLVETQAKLFPGISEALERLSTRATLALLSNGSEAYCEANVRRFALDRWISFYRGFTSGVTKAERIRTWSAAMGSPRLIVVGDRESDIHNAREVGAAAVAVTYGMGSLRELQGADALCASPDEIVSVCTALMEGSLPVV